MRVLIKKYLLDFWIWWYWFSAKDVLKDFKKHWIFILGYLNLLPMLTNLFVPLFKDYSWEGRIVAFPIRFTWVIVATILLLLYSALLLVTIICYFALPLLPVVVIYSSLFVQT